MDQASSIEIEENKNIKKSNQMKRRTRRKKLDKDFISFSSNEEINFSQHDCSSEDLLNIRHSSSIEKLEGESGVYKCVEADCGKEFEDKISLRKHILNHGEKLFVCEYPKCGKKFLDNSKLRRHSLVHTVNKIK